MTVRRRDVLLALATGTLVTACGEPGTPGSMPVQSKLPTSPVSARIASSQAAEASAAQVAGAVATTTTDAFGLVSGSLRDRVGVNVHWTYPDTPYGAQYEAVRKLLQTGGIRHVRGDLSRATDLAKLGIYTTLQVDLDVDGKGDPLAQVKAAEVLIKQGAVVAVEGPNESDLFWADKGRTYKGQPFPAGPLAWQRDLYAAVKAVKTTRTVPVIGMSFGKTYWGGGHPYGRGELEASCDWGNFHPYAAGNPFTQHNSYAGIDNYYANADFPSVTLDQYPINISTYQPPFGSRPMAATETGYSTWSLGQSERVQGWYTARTALEFVRLGIKRTYLYELVDEFEDAAGTNREAHFGLLRRDLSAKPAYVALRSLLTIVGDGVPAADGVPVAGVDYSITVQPPGGYDPAALHHLAFAMPDGSATIALWHEVSADDLVPLQQNPQQPIRYVDQPSMDVTVTVKSRQSAATHLPTASLIGDDGKLLGMTITRTQTTARMPVDGRVVLLRL